MNVLHCHRRGISRPEVLLVLSILLGLASIIFPAILEISQRNRSMECFGDMRILISAANRFNQEYRLWPVAELPEKGDARFGLRNPNTTVLNILRGIDSQGNEQHRLNPSQIDFIDEASEGQARLRYNARGEVVDPWGSPYEMVFDSTYDSISTVENNVYGPVIGEGVIIWSSGPDRKSETRDDLKSWLP